MCLQGRIGVCVYEGESENVCVCVCVTQGNMLLLCSSFQCIIESGNMFLVIKRFKCSISSFFMEANPSGSSAEWKEVKWFLVYIPPCPHFVWSLFVLAYFKTQVINIRLTLVYKYWWAVLSRTQTHKDTHKYSTEAWTLTAPNWNLREIQTDPWSVSLCSLSHTHR